MVVTDQPTNACGMIGDFAKAIYTPHLAKI